MPTAREANRRYFENAYRTGEHGWAVEQPSPCAVRYLRRIRRETGAGRLLDLGCGEGRHAIAAARLGFRVTGVDFEPLALRRARRFARSAGAQGIVYRRADALSLPFGKAAFDVVLDFGCLHHQRKADWPAYQEGLLRVLKPEGHFVLSVFSPRFRLFEGGTRRWHIAFGSYRRCFTPEDIDELFGRDFEVIERHEERGEDGGFWHTLMRRRGESASS